MTTKKIPKNLRMTRMTTPRSQMKPRMTMSRRLRMNPKPKRNLNLNVRLTT